MSFENWKEYVRKTQEQLKKDREKVNVDREKGTNRGTKKEE